MTGDSHHLNASDPPDGDLVREVYAYFGLCIYLSQVFETGLINILTALETAVSKKPTPQIFESLYSKHQTFTFGRLLNSLSVHCAIPDDLMREVRELKAVRDHLAHQFFRDHDLDFMSIGGCYVMIEILEAHRARFKALDERVSALQAEAFSKIGIDPDQFGATTTQLYSEMLEEARARYSSSLPDRK